MSAAPTQPRLRYHAPGSSPAPGSPAPGSQTPTGRETSVTDPMLSATDPRWVLARRVSEAMQGAVLEPAQRDRLIRLGRVMGLNAFESNLVIAIVQDQARRGLTIDGAVASLGMVPISGRRPRSRWRRVAVWVGLTLAAELMIVALWLL